jgi:hypothetical protein
MRTPPIRSNQARSIPTIRSSLVDERILRPIDIALRITFHIVGPVPVMMLAVGLMAIFELSVELIFWNSSYYQDHRWCPFAASLIAGAACLIAWCRFPYLESGVFIGPLIIGFGFYFLTCR